MFGVTLPWPSAPIRRSRMPLWSGLEVSLPVTQLRDLMFNLRASRWAPLCVTLPTMRWTLALPAWVWVVLIVFIYIAIKSPAVAVFALGLPARFIAGLGNGVITILRSFM